MNALMNSSALKAATVVNAIEIDFLPVGEKTKSGDAIAIRYGDKNGSYEIMVVDGGDRDAGKRMVAHLKSLYGDDVEVTHMVCTHSDGDHASGLRDIIDELPVKNLWVHQPWNYAAVLNPKFKGAWTDENLAKHLREDCFPIVAHLCDLAEDKGVMLREPIAGQLIGPFMVLAPSLARYLDLVPQMDQTPLEKSAAASFMESIKTMAQSVFGTLEFWGVETLQDPAEDATSIPNETSVVLFGEVADKRLLLTADAGVGALGEAVETAQSLGLNILSPDLFQMPHHGSRHNVGPTILDQILGPKLDDEDNGRGWAIASCAKECPKKPYRSVTNALKRRGYRSGHTKSGVVTYPVGWPMRAGFNPLTPIEFYSLVED